MEQILLSYINIIRPQLSIALVSIILQLACVSDIADLQLSIESD